MFVDVTGLYSQAPAKPSQPPNHPYEAYQECLKAAQRSYDGLSQTCLAKLSPEKVVVP